MVLAGPNTLAVDKDSRAEGRQAEVEAEARPAAESSQLDLRNRLSRTCWSGLGRSR